MKAGRGAAPELELMAGHTVPEAACLFRDHVDTGRKEALDSRSRRAEKARGTASAGCAHRDDHDRDYLAGRGKEEDVVLEAHGRDVVVDHVDAAVLCSAVEVGETDGVEESSGLGEPDVDEPEPESG